MSRLLRLDSSPRVEDSHSRELAADVERRWRAANPGGEVVVRDLAATPVPHLNQTTLSAFLDPDYRDKPDLKAAAAFSDELIAELKAADEVIVSAPMYNFSVPSVLKAWIDHIVRYGLTFEVTGPGEYRGLLETNRVWIVTSAGGAYSEGPFQAYNFLAPYLEALFGFLGVTDVTRVGVENTEVTPEAMKVSRDAATTKLQELFGEA